MQCKICDQLDCIDYFIISDKIIRCSKCNTIYAENTNSKYPQVVGSNKIKITFQKRFARLLAENYFDHLKIKTDLPFKTALDVGAGFGSFVRILREFGIKADGIESDEKTIKNQETNIELGFFDENYPESKYDLISINQCLYYFNDCFTILKKVSQMLAKNGMLFIATINPESSFRLENKLWTQGSITALSKQRFASLNYLGLELIDVTSYDDNFYIDYLSHRKNLITTKKFIINAIFYFLKLKKLVTTKQNGINNFILLRKIDN